MPKHLSKKPSRSGTVFNVTIGDNASLVAVGENIQQTSLSQTKRKAITEKDIALTRELFAQFRSKIQQEVAPNKRKTALVQIDKIEGEIISKKPKVSAFENAKRWFGKNAPGLLGTLISVFVHPIVGKIVEATGEMAADEFRKHIQERRDHGNT